MKLLVTGASGFLGRSVVAEATRRGHDVRSVVRPQTDLRSRRGLVELFEGIDAVIHLAACKGGDVYAQYAGTVVATENLLWAMSEAKSSAKFIHISSFSV